MSDMLMETYLRQQVDKGEYGVAIIQAQIALDIANYIEKHRQPTIEPERKKGRWVDVTDGICVWKVCDQCGEKPLWNEWKTDRDLSNFCPNCGADMRGEEHGD